MAGHAQSRIEITVDALMAVREETRDLSWQDLLLPDARQLSQGLRLTETRGMEYRESRAYVVGDEFRSIDWRAMARSGEAYTKIFSDQLEQTAMLAIDLSESMFFGTSYSFKSWTTARLAAFIAWLCERSQLPLQVLLISRLGLIRIPLDSAKRNLPRLFRALSEHCHYTGPGQHQQPLLNQLLGQCNDVMQAGSLVFLLSDCLGTDLRSNRLFADISRKNKSVIGRVYDQSEQTSWPSGSYHLQVDQQVINYQQLQGKQLSAVDRLQLEIAERIQRFTALASRQLLLSCNSDLKPQLRDSLVRNHDQR